MPPSILWINTWQKCVTFGFKLRFAALKSIVFCDQWSFWNQLSLFVKSCFSRGLFFKKNLKPFNFYSINHCVKICDALNKSRDISPNLTSAFLKDAFSNEQMCPKLLYTRAQLMRIAPTMCITIFFTPLFGYWRENVSTFLEPNCLPEMNESCLQSVIEMLLVLYQLLLFFSFLFKPCHLTLTSHALTVQ